MKTIIAFIRINKIIATKKALSESGISSMTAFGHCSGRGKGYWDAKVMEGVRNNEPEALALIGDEPRLRPQTMIMVTVPENKSKTVVDAIMEANHTGESGDGKIFVLPEYDVVRVRTGETGRDVLD